MVNLSTVVELQNEFFKTDITRDVSFRKSNLESLLQAIKDSESAVYAALKADFGKSEAESYLTEVSPVVTAIRYAIKNIDRWTKTRRLSGFFSKSYVIPEGLGTILIMSPWNMAFLFSLIPVIGAMAAGNCIVLKPSKSSPNTSQILANVLNSTFDRRCLYVLEAPLPYDEILRQPYSHIFFTGSERVGRLVMRAASEKGIPVTLQLGGKNPCIIDKTADIDMAAKRIMLGKIINSGQSCMAPDFAAVDSQIKDLFIERLRFYKRELLGELDVDQEYACIVDLHHYIRIKNIIEKEDGVIGGKFDDKIRQVEPAIIPNAGFDSVSMKEEIFGPILPVIAYDSIDTIYDYIKSGQKPLACYIFSKNSRFINRAVNQISCGGCCINDCAGQLDNGELPFGMAGNGKYNGKAGFDLFSNYKTVINSAGDNPLRYPPYSKEKYAKIRV